MFGHNYDDDDAPERKKRKKKKKKKERTNERKTKRFGNGLWHLMSTFIHRCAHGAYTPKEKLKKIHIIAITTCIFVLHKIMFLSSVGNHFHGIFLFLRSSSFTYFIYIIFSKAST